MSADRRRQRGRGPGPARARSRSGARTAFVVGRRPALEAVRSGRALEVLVAQGARSTPGLREVAEAAGVAAVPVQAVPAERIESLAGETVDQGVAARVSLPSPLSESDLARRSWAEDALVLAVDGVTDPHNLGALARSAEAAGAEAMVVRRHRAAPVSAAAVKASAGALIHLPLAEVANVPRALGRLRDAGFWVVGLDADAPTRVDAASVPPGRLVLVAGSEGGGLSRLVRAACDELVSIPLRGRVASLNVSVAAGVALFTYAATR